MSTVIALAAVLFMAVPAGVAVGAQADAYRSGAGSSRVTIAAAPLKCSDKAYTLEGARWTKTLKWSFQTSSTPLGLSQSSAAAILQQAFNNITSAHNGCGRVDRVSATNQYLGTTAGKAGVTNKARCGKSDGKNVVGFGPLPVGTLGLTCFRYAGRRMTEIDIRLSSNINWWAGGSCSFGAYSLEGVATHEAGHAFGLGHVSEKKHGNLVMSTHINGPCQNSEASLGLGDMRGLEALYNH